MKTLLQSLKTHWLAASPISMLMIFSVLVYVLPAFVEQRLYETLSDAGYTQIDLAQVKWSGSGLGFELASLKAAGENVPALNVSETDVWLETSRLWNGALGVRLRSKLLAGEVQLRLWHQIWSVHGNAEVRFDGISIAKLMEKVPNLAETLPFLADKHLDGKLWLSATATWKDLVSLDIPITVNASLADLTLVHRDKTTLLSLHKLRLKDLRYTSLEDADVLIYTADIEVEKFVMRNAGLNRDVSFPLTADALHIQGLSIAKNQHISISQTALRGLQLGEGTQTLAGLEDLVFTDLRLQPEQQLTINHINLGQGKLFLVKTKEGQWQPLELLLASLPKAKDKSAQAIQDSPMKIAVNNIDIKAVDLTMTDASFARDKVLKANIKAATLNNVTLHQSQQPTLWRVEGSLGENGAWTSKGAIWLDDLEKEVDATLTIHALELAPYSGYVERKFGSGILSGNMDADLQAKVRAGDVDVSGTLLARKASLKASDSFLDVGKDWSLSSAVDVLRDSDNNVNLNIAAEGKLSDPTFKFAGLWDKVLKEAVQSTTISYLAQTMQPYGLAYTIGQYLYEQSKTIELKPFVFETGAVLLTAKSPDLDGYSEKIAQLLKKRPTYILEICPRFVAGETDIQESLSQERVRLLTQRLQILDLLPSRWTVCEPKLDARKQATSRLALRLL